MTMWLKQSTAVTIKLGPFLDAEDGVTAEDTLTISQADVRLSKNGGNIAQKNESSSATHDELGYYDVALDATDTDTLGRLLLAVSETGALPVWQTFMVVPANVWDSLFGADKLQVHADEITAELITAAAFDTDAIDANALAADAVAEIQSGLATVAGILAATVEGTLDVQEALRLMLSVLVGKSSGGGTSNVVFRDTTDTLDRVDATVDSNGNRSAVTLDPS